MHVPEDADRNEQIDRRRFCSRQINAALRRGGKSEW